MTANVIAAADPRLERRWNIAQPYDPESDQPPSELCVIANSPALIPEPLPNIVIVLLNRGDGGRSQVIQLDQVSAWCLGAALLEAAGISETLTEGLKP
jgi:hypothetical protein